jgi:hypothetical protein
MVRNFEDRETFKVGEEGEEIVAKLFDIFGVEKIPAKTFKESDFKLDEYNFTIEVKNDRGSLKSNNYFIETKQNQIGDWKPSGLNITTSNLWIQLRGNIILIMNTNKLKEFIELNKNEFRFWEGKPITEEADKKLGMTAGYLIPQRILENTEFTLVFDMNRLDFILDKKPKLIELLKSSIGN